LKTLFVIALFIIFFMSIVVLIDIIPLIKRRISRIHIGQWSNFEEWQITVENALLEQLKKTPRIPLSDNTRLTFIERLRGTYTNPALNNWQQAALLLGANEMCGCEEIRKRIENFIGSKINVRGEWLVFEAKPETAMLAFAVLNSPIADKNQIRPAMKKTAEMLFEYAEKTGTVPYNNNVPDIRFVDTIGMICPFLAKYAFCFDCPQALKLAYRQIEEFAEFGMHDKFSIPVHCFNLLTGAPLGIFGWGRGCGWWAEGLMDTYLVLSNSTLPADAKLMRNQENLSVIGEMEKFLLEQMISFANALIRFQMNNGAWDRQIFLMTDSESSATAMLAWFMKKMFKITYNEVYRISYDKAADFLVGVTRRDGTVDFAQGDTKGIGFYSGKLEVMHAAQGFTVRSMTKGL